MAGLKIKLYWIIVYFILQFCSIGSAIEQSTEPKINLTSDTTAAYYFSLVEKGYQGEALYYNTSRAYFLNGNYAAAILFAEKALKWNPHCFDCNVVLELALKKAELERFELPGWSPVASFEKFSQMVSHQCWFILAMIFLSLFLGMHFGWFSSVISLSGHWLKKLILLFTLLFILISWHRYYLLNRVSHWILMENSGLYKSADNNSAIQMNLNAGTKLLKTDQIGSWYKLRTFTYDEGWIEEIHLKPISK